MAEYTDDDVTRLATLLGDVSDLTWGNAAVRLLQQGVTLPPPPPDPERSDAEVLADLVALSDAGRVQVHMTHVDEGLPVYEVSWRKLGWLPPPYGPDIAAAGRSLGWPVARVLEMAQPYINPPPDPAVVVTKDLAARVWPDMGWGPAAPMAEFTDADVTRLAEMLEYLGVMLPDIVARRLLEQGVTLPPPPPDPAVVVAKALSLVLWPYFAWDPAALHPEQERLLAAVRDLFTTDALKAAAAKVQEAKS